MGEIGVKTANLFDISSDIHGYINSSGNFVPNNLYTATDYIEIPPNARTLYCSAITKSGQPVYTGLHVAVYDENKTLLTYDMDYNKSKISMSVDISLGKYFRADVCSNDYTECMVSFENVPYQPYFLTLPSHQKTSNGWKDIPTHTMTATGWQGELTSQSPLEFRATGQSLLDWRVEGKTSGNLFDISTDFVPHLAFSYGKIVILQENTSAGFYVKCQPDKYYTLSRAKNTNNRFSIGFTADEPVTGAHLLFYTPVQTSEKSITALSPSNANYLCAYLTNQNDPITEDLQLMLNEGSTALPYEPYSNGVGDYDETAQRYKIPVTVNGVTTNLYTDHQLMDGDSIDYTTTETQIPIATGNNTLTVDTAVKPKSVFIKFEG